MFEGFTPETVDFLWGIRMNNNRDWFLEHKKDYVNTLYEPMKALGKELIVRTFASIEEDYQMMLDAYEQISTEMMVMDKWTQFDWSLTMPHNAFYNKIKNNPLFVEGDIFGEFFGKGRLPLMLKEHIGGKFDYCQKYLIILYTQIIHY